MTPAAGNIADEKLAQVISRLAEHIRPDKIILFGSYAWGSPTEDSDIDLFIIVEESAKQAYRRAQDVYRILRGLSVPVEVLVYTRAEVERARKVATSLTAKVLAEGRVLYG